MSKEKGRVAVRRRRPARRKAAAAALVRFVLRLSRMVVGTLPPAQRRAAANDAQA